MMFQPRTRSQQILEHYYQLSKHRRLTDEEWRDVARAEHAEYERNRREQIRTAEREERAA